MPFSNNRIDVKHVFFSPYHLKPKGLGPDRQGVLLKIEFRDGQAGHADLHPYPEKKEKPVGFYLKALEQKNFEFKLCQRALSIARTEALAQEQNLLSPLNIPPSHYLITDIEKFNAFDKALDQGFRVFKVKLGNPLKAQTKKLLALIKYGGPAVKWRLDFHCPLTKREWQEWTKESLVCLSMKGIDFIEAPFDYIESGFLKKSQSQFLAWDVWSGENTLPVYALVLKSSRKAPEKLLKKPVLFQRVIFTHTLAHPLDQVSSAYFAGSFYKVLPRLREVCGLVQTNIYEKGAWSLPDKGPLFPKLSGPGWGLCHLLDRLSWKKLF